MANMLFSRSQDIIDRCLATYHWKAHITCSKHMHTITCSLAATAYNSIYNYTNDLDLYTHSKPVCSLPDDSSLAKTGNELLSVEP